MSFSPEKEAELKALFASYDINSDGHISCEELKSAFAKLGATISEDEIANMVRNQLLIQMPNLLVINFQILTFR